MSTQHHRRSARRTSRAVALTAALASFALIATGCTADTGNGGSEFGFPAAEQVPGSEITVLVDTTREPLALAFQEQFPDVPIKIETYDGNPGGSGSLQTKIALFDQAGSGWPDVVFSSQTNDASWAAKETNGVQAYAAVLNQGLMDQEFLDSFMPGALDPVTVDGTVYGLRNDLAPVVLWYDQTLFDEFGYEIPTTWEEFKDLSDVLAEEHPGYIMGSMGGGFMAVLAYYWGAAAPIFQVDGDTFSTDFSDPNTVAMTELIDHMLANGTLTNTNVFDPAFVTNYKDKVLTMPGPAWFAGVIFQNPGILDAAPGQIGAANPLYWEGQEEVTGNVGGGTWYGSSHSTNLEAVAQFLEFVTSSDSAVELASGLPAQKDAVDAYLAKQEEAGYFVGDFTGALTKAAGSVWSGWSFPNFSAETAWDTIVNPVLSEGGTVASAVEAWEQEYRNQAQVQGYTVK
ncbi:ABC transporter substrate-binding protein [Microcella sp.]|uniref:ABC transporter substrate-binding protein n=1 Tax=Microcella sp. TaxID=1913979 RepID=UPI003F72F448